MTASSPEDGKELPTRFTVPELPVRDCVELAAGLASYARRHGIAQVEVAGPVTIGELIKEFGFDEVRYVDAHRQPAVTIPATPRTWRCGHRGLSCFVDQLAAAPHALAASGTCTSTLAEGTVLRFDRHNRLGDALSIVTGLERYCRDNVVYRVAVTGSPALAEVVGMLDCKRVGYAASHRETVSGDALFARSSWSVPWLDRFNHALADGFAGRAHHRAAPLPVRHPPPHTPQEPVVYCQFDARSSTPPPQRTVRRLLQQVSAHGEVRVLGGPDTRDYLGPDLTYVRADLPEMVARLLSCRLFVGCDSGLGHLAGCLGVPGLIVTTEDSETTWAFFREYASLSVISLRAVDVLLP